MAVTVSLVGGCSYLPPALRGEPSRPGWVQRGSGYFEGGAGKAFYGVGAASGIADLGLRREAAEAAARADLARMLRSQVSSLLLSYAAATGSNAGDSSERHTERSLRVSAEADLAGVTVVDRFSERGGEVEYALVVMDDRAFRAHAGRLGLSADEQRRIREQAERAFQRLAPR
jgi:hypothetical protein